ncbi:MAG TPA: bifunctional glutamine synthetase adenylyltransferase/deadenyltransferase, partial [Gammaproteobacteria bacterium]|nr:bifunctional glutamine synthetase adenylyltransferase/deadenyltransferase [Gammaproteobacteria bacterium]
MVSGDALAFPGRAANVPPEARPALQLAHERTAALLARLNDPRLDAVAAILPRVFMASEFAAHLCEAEPGFLRDLVVSGDVTRAYSPGTYTALAEQCCVGDADEAELLRALRRLRNREMLRIAWRDLVGWADLDETLGDLSDLADACLTVALSRLARRHAERYGIARDAAGHPQSLVVLGMGKLGAHELNFSSDIDLMLAFPEEGESDGVRPLASTEYFTRLAQRLIRTLDEKTADGFVFRVDMRLRPFGDSGPLVMTFGAMEAYYQTHGREWERYALIKARPVAGDLAQGER